VDQIDQWKAEGKAAAPEQLGRFGHHPGPAIDFCVEVLALMEIGTDRKLGVENPEDESLERRVAAAMAFTVGGNQNAISAKTELVALDGLLRSGKLRKPSAADLPEGEYAIAEIMGHSTMIGRFAEVERFGTKMLQIEPIWENKLLPAVFVGGASLYRFTPCTREVAFARQPKARYQLPQALLATLPPEPKPALPAPDRDPIDDDEMPF
jgi:hypothetical protein